MAAGPRGLSLAQYFATLQQPETRIDVVRANWIDQMTDTERLLTALEAIPGTVAGIAAMYYEGIRRESAARA